ncbi:MAG: DUF192 domain-containing protein [Acidobacteriota bacterium]|nr:DUF192 domain-containing protein [Acidobacteriota bacterium]
MIRFDSRASALLLALVPFAALSGASGCNGAGHPASPSAAGPPASAAFAPAPASGPRVEMPSGSIYRLELAKTPEDQAQGLMYRESLPEKSGMLFLFSDPGVHKFWMKNTMIPLDMIWLDPEGKVLFVSADTPPCKADPCANYGPDAAAASVLEIAGGMTAKEKVTVGSKLEIHLR